MNQIGIITALVPEAACLTNAPVTPEEIIRIDNNICVYVSGIGAERAENAARMLINHGMDILVSCGTAGALADDLNPGDLIVPELITGFDGRTYQTAKHWRSSIVNKMTDIPCNIYLGQLADSMRVLTSADDKSDMNEKNRSVIAVDMESAAIAAVAFEKEIPCIVIRVISDSSRMMIPEIALKVSDHYGRVNISRLVIQIVTNPGQIPQLYGLARGFRKAEVTLKWIGERLSEIFS